MLELQILTLILFFDAETICYNEQIIGDAKRQITSEADETNYYLGHITLTLYKNV